MRKLIFYKAIFFVFFGLFSTFSQPAQTAEGDTKAMVPNFDHTNECGGITADNVNSFVFYFPHTDGIPNEYIISKDHGTRGPTLNLDIDVVIEAGIYEVAIEAYEPHGTHMHMGNLVGHGPDPELNQSKEIWQAIFMDKDGLKVNETPFNETMDVSDADDPEIDHWDVHGPWTLEFTSDVTKIDAYHPYYGTYNAEENPERWDSVYPVCVGLAKKALPTGHIIGNGWCDNNLNGIKDENVDFPLDFSIVVNLSNDQSIHKEVNGAEFNYEFKDLPAGDYTVTFEPSAGFEPTTGLQRSVTVTAGETTTAAPAGFGPCSVPPPGRISGSIWCDENQDGLPGDNVPFLENFTFAIVHLTGPVEHTVHTVQPVDDPNHQFYQFAELPDGDYTVTFVPPPDYRATTNTVYHVTLKNGERENSQPDAAGFWPCASPPPPGQIMGRVWCDDNKNRIIDDSVGFRENDLITVQLSGPLHLTKTTQDGYEFKNLPDGAYKVTFIPSRDGLEPTTGLEREVTIVDGKVFVTPKAAGFWPCSSSQEAEARINLELGRDAATGARIPGVYRMFEVGTNKLLIEWHAESWWVDSGCKKADISRSPTHVEVYFYPDGHDTRVKLEIVNPAPDEPYGWLKRGMCHAIEVQFPIDWSPSQSQPSNNAATSLIGGQGDTLNETSLVENSGNIEDFSTNQKSSLNRVLMGPNFIGKRFFIGKHECVAF